MVARCRRIADRVSNNVWRATNAWATLKALDRRVGANSRFKAALDWCWPRELQVIADGLHLETLLALARVTDAPGGDRQTVCALAKELKNDDVRVLLQSKDWLARDCPQPALAWEIEEQPKRLDAFCKLVPPTWKNDTLTPDRRLWEFRQAVRPLRGQVLAHSVEIAGQLSVPNPDSVEAGLAVCAEVAELGRLIFRGNGPALDRNLDGIVRRRGTVWEFFERGLVSAHADWVEQTLNAELEQEKPPR